MARWEAVQGCISYRAKESRSVQVCSLYFCVVPDLRQRPGLQQTVAALGALLRCQPRARFALAFKVKLASACAGLQFAYVGKLQTASAPLASPTLLPALRGGGEPVPVQDAAPTAAYSAHLELTFFPTLLVKNDISSFVMGNFWCEPGGRHAAANHKLGLGTG